MYVASCNFDAGEGLKYQKGQEVKGKSSEVYERLLKEHLIEECDPESHVEPEPIAPQLSATDVAEAKARDERRKAMLAEKEAAKVKRVAPVQEESNPKNVPVEESKSKKHKKA